MKRTVCAGIDLHSNNVMIAVVDEEGHRLRFQKLPCDLNQIVAFLQPWKKRLRSVAVESTYNWYWLVDGLRAQGYSTHLANPAGMEQYSGIKHADDKNDAFFLADLQRLNILPTGYVYDPKIRPTRDLLRRRLGLVRQRTALLLSFKSLYCRTTGQTMALQQLKMMKPEEGRTLYEDRANCLIAELQKQHIDALSQSIEVIEKEVLSCARKLPRYERVTSLPGVGDILGMTITMEVGEIGRFATPENFASYCRMVNSICLSNKKKKGENNRKCGNRYLSWAFVEAANFAKRYDEDCRRWFDRKAAKTNKILATKALGCKLAKAAWHLMSEGRSYDAQRMFGPVKSNDKTQICESRCQPERRAGRRTLTN